MKSNRKLVLMLSGLLMAPVAIADQTADYTCLSMGAVRDNSGWANPLTEKFADSVDGFLSNESLVLKKSTMGGYLRGSYDLGNGLFTEMRLRGFNNRSLGYFVGLGYYMPIGENASFYVLAGLSQPDLPREVRLNAVGKKGIKQGYSALSAGYYARYKSVHEVSGFLHRVGVPFQLINQVTGGLPNNQSILEGCQANNIDSTERLERLAGLIAWASTTNALLISDKAKEVDAIIQSKLTVKSKIAPAIEIGSRIKLTDDFKVRLAYQVRYDRSKLEGELFNLSALEVQSISETRRGLSHEGSIEGYYALGANWQAEAGYTISKMLKLGNVSPKAGHQVNVGLRYAF